MRTWVTRKSLSRTIDEPEGSMRHHVRCARAHRASALHVHVHIHVLCMCFGHTRDGESVGSHAAASGALRELHDARRASASGCRWHQHRRQGGAHTPQGGIRVHAGCWIEVRSPWGGSNGERERPRRLTPPPSRLRGGTWACQRRQRKARAPAPCHAGDHPSSSPRGRGSRSGRRRAGPRRYRTRLTRSYP